jgi:HEAT repeat protein
MGSGNLSKSLFSAVLLAPMLLAPALAQSISNEERCKVMLMEALHEKNPDTRKEGVTALSLASTGEPFRTELEKMLDDKDLSVRLAVLAGISELKDARAIEMLKKALKDDTPEVSFTAARALWALQDAAGREALLSVLNGDSKTSSGFIKSQTRDAMRMMHTPRTLFLFALKQGVGFAPIPGLGEGISSMQGILSDAGVSGRATAALLLAKDKSPETVTALKDALKDKDASVRAAAVHALSLRNDPAVQAEFLPLLLDKKESVRLRAAAGFLRLESIRNTPPPASAKAVSRKAATSSVKATSPKPAAPKPAARTDKN